MLHSSFEFSAVSTHGQPGTQRRVNASKALGTHGRPGRCRAAGVFQQRTFCSHTRGCRGRSRDTILLRLIEHTRRGTPAPDVADSLDGAHLPLLLLLLLPRGRVAIRDDVKAPPVLH